MKNVSAYRIIGSFLLGSAVLIILSFIQKLIAGFNPYILKAYLIPFLFGGITGTLIGLYIAKINELNQKLLQRVDSLEHLLPPPHRSSCQMISAAH